jgi:hypothetical protein
METVKYRPIQTPDPDCQTPKFLDQSVGRLAIHFFWKSLKKIFSTDFIATHSKQIPVLNSLKTN